MSPLFEPSSQTIFKFIGNNWVGEIYDEDRRGRTFFEEWYMLSYYKRWMIP